MATRTPPSRSRPAAALLAALSLAAGTLGPITARTPEAPASAASGAQRRGMGPPAAPPAATEQEEAKIPALERLKSEAAALAPLVRTPFAKAFVSAVPSLPSIAPRTLHHDAARTRFYTDGEAAALPEAERTALTARAFDDTFYWYTRYGTPLAYARALDLIGERGLAPAGARILDFGYGGIGQLRLLAMLGAEAVGVEVNPVTRALYAHPGDQGTIRGVAGRDGRLTLVHGRWPGEPDVAAAVGGGFDLILSKNVLKRGYVHPEQPIPDSQKVILSVDDAAFVRALWGALKPGGLVMIYNLSPAPAPAGQPYRPWADGRCPFDRALLEAAGFKVLLFDENDDAAARAMGHALGWDEGPTPMDLEKDLFAHVTLLERPRG